MPSCEQQSCKIIENELIEKYTCSVIFGSNYANALEGVLRVCATVTSAERQHHTEGKS